MNETGSPRYDAIGDGYSSYRREDPRFYRRICTALGTAKSVLNVGAGAGSYEPRDRYVMAVEPSDVMAAQRPPDRPPAIRAYADALPFRDASVDAAMSVLSLHHWDDAREAGVRELRRVARGPVVIITYDPEVSARMWLMADYLVEVAELDREIFPAPEEIADWLGGATIEVLPIPADTPDWMLGSFWAHPKRVLDEGARNATSGFARQPPAVIQRVEATSAEPREVGRSVEARLGFGRAQMWQVRRPNDGDGGGGGPGKRGAVPGAHRADHRV